MSLYISNIYLMIGIVFYTLSTIDHMVLLLNTVDLQSDEPPLLHTSVH